jgi:serine/threonine protein kinase
MFPENTRISDDMTIICHLGSGSFGNVFLVCVKGKNYAMKVGIDIPLSSKQPSAIQREMNIFELQRQHPEHPNLIQSFSIKFPLGPAILMELGQETIDDKIKYGTLTFKQTMEIILQILSAVTFLHSIGISHNDLKPDNIIFVGGVPKLFDFNLSYRWEKDDSFRSHLCGTRGYKHPSPTTNYAQDMISWVFILIEMLIGENIRSYNSKTPSGIAELSIFDIEIKLREKQVSNENIQKILQIFQLRQTIELNRLIELAQSIQ